MGITVSDFGKTESGEEASLYVLKNDAGMTAVVSDLGAVLVSLFVPDRDGELRDVVLGFDDVESYEKKKRDILWSDDRTMRKPYCQRTFYTQRGGLSVGCQ